MSRKYCDICGDNHNNGGQGLCDEHMISEDQRIRDEWNHDADMFEEFLAKDDKDKWFELWEQVLKGTERNF